MILDYAQKGLGFGYDKRVGVSEVGDEETHVIVRKTVTYYTIDVDTGTGN